jgi:2,5-diketo-D-gluconate reductase A
MICNDDQGDDQALRAGEAAHARMRFEPIDLRLLQWPLPGKSLPAWRALERLRGDG